MDRSTDVNSSDAPLDGSAEAPGLANGVHDLSDGIAAGVDEPAAAGADSQASPNGVSNDLDSLEPKRERVDEDMQLDPIETELMHDLPAESPAPVASTSALQINGHPNGPPLDMTRNEALAERQHDIEEIMAEHDDHVRELFHLDRFTSLVYYDPVAAKQDNSSVYTEVRSISPWRKHAV